MSIFNNLVLRIGSKSKKVEKPERKESLLMDLINDPDSAEITIKKEADEIVIRVRRNTEA